MSYNNRRFRAISDDSSVRSARFRISKWSHIISKPLYIIACKFRNNSSPQHPVEATANSTMACGSRRQEENVHEMALGQIILGAKFPVVRHPDAYRHTRR